MTEIGKFFVSRKLPISFGASNHRISLELNPAQLLQFLSFLTQAPEPPAVIAPQPPSLPPPTIPKWNISQNCHLRIPQNSPNTLPGAVAMPVVTPLRVAVEWLYLPSITTSTENTLTSMGTATIDLSTQKSRRLRTTIAAGLLAHPNKAYPLVHLSPLYVLAVPAAAAERMPAPPLSRTPSPSHPNQHITNTFRPRPAWSRRCCDDAGQNVSSSPPPMSVSQLLDRALQCRPLKNLAIDEGFVANRNGIQSLRIGIDAVSWLSEPNITLQDICCRLCRLLGLCVTAVFLFDKTATQDPLAAPFNALIEAFGFYSCLTTLWVPKAPDFAALRKLWRCFFQWRSVASIPQGFLSAFVSALQNELQVLQAHVLHNTVAETIPPLSSFLSIRGHSRTAFKVDVFIAPIIAAICEGAGPPSAKMCVTVPRQILARTLPLLVQHYEKCSPIRVNAQTTHSQPILGSTAGPQIAPHLHRDARSRRFGGRVYSGAFIYALKAHHASHPLEAGGMDEYLRLVIAGIIQEGQEEEKENIDSNTSSEGKKPGGRKKKDSEKSSATAQTLAQNTRDARAKYTNAENTTNAYKGYLARGAEFLASVVVERKKREAEDPTWHQQKRLVQ
ncbi:hypothetical protein R3P38DRAFT_2804227 [Favolaschia claudopus]|uniref:Uncharacterized protein n=1 Tax=Favolaschia claudopus TaxID=2862362 RepID=A0AAV9ZRH7_9AGAR